MKSSEPTTPEEPARLLETTDAFERVIAIYRDQFVHKLVNRIPGWLHCSIEISDTGEVIRSSVKPHLDDVHALKSLENPAPNPAK